MYEIPKIFTNLQDRLKPELEERGSNRFNASLISKVELGMELISFLGLDEEPIVVLWVLLSQTPVRHPRLQQLGNDQLRAISNARILLPGYAGRFGWESALRDYMRQVPLEMRSYDFDVEQLDKQIFHACRTPRIFNNRIEVFRECLTQPLPFRQRNIPFVEAREQYTFDAYTHENPPFEVSVDFDKTSVSYKDMKVDWINPGAKTRSGIKISWQDLERVARYIDAQMGGNDWTNRINKVIYRVSDNLKTDLTPEAITIEGFTHLAGMVASGKSTLANLIAAHLIYDHKLNPEAPKYHLTLVLGDTASTIHLADQINRWFGLDPETDQPVAIPVLGRRTRDRHIRQLHESQEYKDAIRKGRTHWGERFLQTACPLQALIPLEKLSQPLIPGTEPCNGLKKAPLPGTPEKSVRKVKFHLCPLFAVCPSQQIYRDMSGAQIWITTPGAMGTSTLPAQLEGRSIRLGDLIYDHSDVVIFDEVETVVEWFDRLYARETKLTGDGEGILDRLDPEVASYQSKNRMLPANTRRWIEAERNFHAPVGHILALLQQYGELKSSIERGYFTSRSLFYRLVRRMLGLKEYEDERDDQKRWKNEQMIESIMPVFERLISGGDPLASGMPNGFRADGQVTAQALIRLRKKIEQLPKSDPSRKEVMEKYQVLVENAAYQLVIIMNQTLNTGDSTQNPVIHQMYQDWIKQFVPDIENSLEKLQQNLQNSSEERDVQYFNNGQVDTLTTLGHRLEFAVNAALLDRHIRIVFYEWHNRPTEVIDDESPYKQTPTSLLNIIPIPPTGRLFGIYHTPNDQVSGVLSTFGYTNIGRAYVTNFHNLRAHLEGRSGPNVLAMSGTSYLPDSTSWHLEHSPKGVLKPAEKCIRALNDKNTWFRYMPLFDKNGAPIRVSGSSDKRDAIIKMAAALVGKIGERGGRLGDELRDLENLARVDPDNWADRERLLLLVNSYEQSKWVAEEIRTRWPDMVDKIYHLEASLQDQEVDDDDVKAGGSLGRVDIELFAQKQGRILVAPLQAIGRRFNILNEARKAAFGAVYFLTRPMPHPHDVPAIAQEINRRTYDWFNDAEFVAWKEGDGVYARGAELRRRAEEYWRKVELRSFYRQLKDEKDTSKYSISSKKFHANPRRDLAATTAGKIIQAVGRLLRGDVPFHAYFVDSAWGPQQAKRLRGEDVELDTPKTSLLAAIIDVMADYVSEPVGNALYEPLFNKLDRIENFDWQPIKN